jgi:hypothetical protein
MTLPNIEHERAVETYKLLIQISLACFKLLALLNGGAAVATAPKPTAVNGYWPFLGQGVDHPSWREPTEGLNQRDRAFCRG